MDNSCIFREFFVACDIARWERNKHALALFSAARPLTLDDDIDFFQIEEAEKGGSTKTIGETMAKTLKSKQLSPHKPKEGKKKRSWGSTSQILQPDPGSDLTHVALGELYGKAKVVLLPVEPYAVHVYWELGPDGLRDVKNTLGKDFRLSQTILRFFDVTNIVFDGTNAHGFFDIPIDLPSMRCYVRLWSCYKAYFAVLGFKTTSNVFFPVARSNIAQTPRDLPARHEDYIPIFANTEDLPKKMTQTELMQTDSEKWKEPKRQSKNHILEKPAADTKGNKTIVDLTAMNERAFSLGVSSQWSPLPSKKDAPNG